MMTFAVRSTFLHPYRQLSHNHSDACFMSRELASNRFEHETQNWHFKSIMRIKKQRKAREKATVQKKKMTIRGRSAKRALP